MSEYM